MIKNNADLQNSASNPLNSVFVSASAGSGKTTVLTKRVLRLLLEGISPAKILCLTFTKVAAYEMQNRIFSELRKWAILNEEELKNQLEKLTNQRPSSLQIKNARQLFAILLDDNSGLQISTIHSFCQSIIKKFPIEAKTSPGFSIIDSQIENELLLSARKKLLSEALLNQNLAEKINLISAHLNENSFLQITAELIQKRENLAELKEKYFGIEGAIQAIYRQLKIDFNESEETVFADFIQDKNWQKKDLLMLCKETEIKSKKVLEKFINQPNLDNLSEYLLVFLTTENEPRKQLTTKPIQKQNPLAEKLMFLEQERVLQFLEKFNASKIAVLTSSLLIVVDRIIEIYTNLKNQNGYLDYNDLIIKTGQLLENSAARDWVKYKLDGIYEHILVDESQDTNHLQWNIVKAISEEFFSGIGAKNQNRSIFIVGDEKQSIYSFQGAEPDIFSEIFHYYQNKLDLINEQFLKIELNNSFRSFPAILQTVDAVFSREDLKKSISNLSEQIQHHPIKNQYFGKVEILPVINSKIINEKKEDEYRWELDFEVDEEYKAQEILAQIIAKKIKNLFTKNKFLLSENRPIKFSDVMILLKDRKNNLGNFLVQYLQAEQIPVSGANRINFSKNIIVQDLLALAKFILLPEDDLNLACLLKSAFFSISEKDLEIICDSKNQENISLFLALKKLNFTIYQELVNLLIQTQKQKFLIGEFFSYFLIEQNKKKAILARFGKDGEEIINQFLKICFDYQNNNFAANLQNFVQFLENADLIIKIDSNNQDKNQVYITTIHSAKGLEAPIVFLADTFHSAKKQLGNDRRKIFWDKKSGLPFWSNGKIFDNSDLKKIKQNEQEIVKKEYWRQLYVAMTRAKEELYICGFGKDSPQENCWYNAIKQSVINHAQEAENIFDGRQIGKSLVIGQDNFGFENAEEKPSLKIVESEFNWQSIDKIPPKEIDEEFLFPSKINPHQFNQINQTKADLGKIIHKILEFLPDLKIYDLKKRDEFLQKYLANKDLSSEQIEKIINQINDVLTKYQDLFVSKNSKAEVPIMAKINGKIISGKIDRLIIQQDKIIIIDFKTGEQNQNYQYQTQMQLYEKVLQKLYPDKKIESKIIWIN